MATLKIPTLETVIEVKLACGELNNIKHVTLVYCGDKKGTKNTDVTFDLDDIYTNVFWQAVKDYTFKGARVLRDEQTLLITVGDPVKSYYFIGANAEGSVHGYIELTQREADIVERALDTDNWKKYYSEAYCASMFIHNDEALTEQEVEDA